MKITALVFVLILALACAQDSHVLTPKNSDDVLKHLEGNNWNVYVLFFAAASAREEIADRNNRAIEEGLSAILAENPSIYSAKIDHANPNFRGLVEKTGVHSAPSLYMMVHGQGVWIYEGTSTLILQRLRDFIPAFNQASANHEYPY